MDFCPISLSSTSYNFIAKLIVNHLKPFLSDYISPSQSSFVLGWNIVDNIIMIKEIAHSVILLLGTKIKLSQQRLQLICPMLMIVCNAILSWILWIAFGSPVELVD